MQTIYTILAEISWLILGTVWFIGFFGNKKTTQLPNRFSQMIANLFLFSAYYFLFYPFFEGSLARIVTPQTALLGSIGVALSIVSVAFAIWARLSLGKNWSGAVITLKADHQLIESGPYKFVRHPIYTGWFFATLGTALTIGTVAAYIALIFTLIGFLIRIRKEEALMTAQFPAAYPEYKTRSKILIPFVW